MYKDHINLREHLEKFTSIFRIPDCYRISKDEIVVLIEDIDENVFNRKVQTLRDMHLEHMSIGSDWKDKANINIMIMLNRAEELIYENEY